MQISTSGKIMCFPKRNKLYLTSDIDTLLFILQKYLNSQLKDIQLLKIWKLLQANFPVKGYKDKDSIISLVSYGFGSLFSELSLALNKEGL